MSEPSEWSPAWRLLCRAILLSPPAPAPALPAMAPADWDSLYDACRRHGLLPLVGRWLGQFPPEMIPASQYERFRDAAAGCILRSLRMQKELQRVLIRFAAAGIPVIPFKGPVLAERIFGDVGLRVFSDLDLLVPDQAVSAAVALLEEQGYRPREGGGTCGWATLLASTNQVEMVHADHPWLVEIHRDFARPWHRYRIPLAELWAGVERCPSSPGLDDELTLLQLCMHGTGHYWSKLKWVVDVDRLVRVARDLDWERLFADAKSIGCTRAVLLGLALAHEYCGTPVPPTAAGKFPGIDWLKQFAVAGWRRPEACKRPLPARVGFILLCRETMRERLLLLWTWLRKKPA